MFANPRPATSTRPAVRFLRGTLTAFIVFFVLLAGRGGPTAVAQQATPAFPSEVQLITVDAVVLNALGRPVRDLTQDDFAVTEDGHPQEIIRFEAFTEVPPDEDEPEPLPAVASNDVGPRAGRAYALMVDDLGLAPAGADTARDAVSSFLERSVRDGDLVTLGTTSGDVWWSARIPEGQADLKAVLGRIKGHYVASQSLDRMTNYEAFWINNHEDSPALARLQPDRPVTAPTDPTSGPDPTGGGIKERVKQRWKDLNLCSGTSCDGMVRGRAADIDGRRKTRTVLTLDALRRGIESLAPVRGRKAMLLFSERLPRRPRDRPPPRDRRVAGGPDRDLFRRRSRPSGPVGRRWLGGRRGVAGRRARPHHHRLPGRRPRVGGDGGPGRRLRRVLGEEQQRPRGGSRADRRRVARVLHARVLPAAGQVVARLAQAQGRGEEAGPQGAGRGAGTCWRKPSRPPRPGGKRGRRAPPDITVVRALDSAHAEAGIPLRAIAYVFEPLPKDATRVLVAAEFDAGSVAAAPEGARRRASST